MDLIVGFKACDMWPFVGLCAVRACVQLESVRCHVRAQLKPHIICWNRLEGSAEVDGWLLVVCCTVLCCVTGSQAA